MRARHAMPLQDHPDAGSGGLLLAGLGTAAVSVAALDTCTGADGVLCSGCIASTPTPQTVACVQIALPVSGRCSSQHPEVCICNNIVFLALHS